MNAEQLATRLSKQSAIVRMPRMRLDNDTVNETRPTYSTAIHTMLDVKRCMSDPEVQLSVGSLTIVAAEAANLIPAPDEHDHRLVVGLGLGGVLMANSVSCASFCYGSQYRFSWTLFAAADTSRGVRGISATGENLVDQEVLIVDDVIRTGHNVSEAVHLVEDLGGQAVGAIVLADRRNEDSSLPSGLPVESVFTYDEANAMFLPRLAA